MATIERDPFACFWEGKDAVPGDANPYPAGTRCWHAWKHGFETEYGERVPMSAAEVAAAFAGLN